MSKLDSRLLFLILVLGCLSIVWGCSQVDDITAPRSLTKVWLTADRLPVPPVGMVYELWVSDVAGELVQDPLASQSAKSLGRFSYLDNDTIRAFLQIDGLGDSLSTEPLAVRLDSNLFILDGDLFDYSVLFVSIEVLGERGTVPGPVMLMEPIDGDTDTLRLVFPRADELWDATARFNMEAVTDNNSGANDGRGLWFSIYGRVLVTIVDTFDVTYDDMVWDTVWPDIDSTSFDTAWSYTDSVCVDVPQCTDWLYTDSTTDSIFRIHDTTNLANLYSGHPDTIWYRYDTTLFRFGRDSLPLTLIDSDTGSNALDDHLRPIHYGAKRTVLWEYNEDSVTNAETCDSIRQANGWDDTVTCGRPFKDYPIIVDADTSYIWLDVFVQGNYGLPDYSAYGWKYQGWIVSDSLGDSLLGSLTPPAWDYKESDLIIPGYQGGLLTTGTFARFNEPDDSDKFSLRKTLYAYHLDRRNTYYAHLDSTIHEEYAVKDTLYNAPLMPGEDFINPDSLSAYLGWTDGPINLLPGTADPSTFGSVIISLTPSNMVTDTTNFPLLAFIRNLPESRTAQVGDLDAGIHGRTLVNYTGTVAGAMGFPKVTAVIRRL